MNVYLLCSDYNHCGDAYKQVLAVYDSLEKAQKSILEEYLATIKNVQFEHQVFWDKHYNNVEIPLVSIVEMENMHYNDPHFIFPVRQIRLYNGVEDTCEDYCYYWIEEKEVL